MIITRQTRLFPSLSLTLFLIEHALFPALHLTIPGRGHLLSRPFSLVIKFFMNTASQPCPPREPGRQSCCRTDGAPGSSDSPNPDESCHQHGRGAANRLSSVLAGSRHGAEAVVTSLTQDSSSGRWGAADNPPRAARPQQPAWFCLPLPFFPLPSPAKLIFSPGRFFLHERHGGY